MGSTKYIVTGEELYVSGACQTFAEFDNFYRAAKFCNEANRDPNWSYRLFVVEKEYESYELKTLEKLEEI